LQNSFQSVPPETFRNQFLSVADYRFIARGQFLFRFVASGPFLYRFVASGPFRKHCNTVAKSFLHKRRLEMFLSISAGFSLQIRFKQKVSTDISE
jgi:hypothetical protein